MKAIIIGGGISGLSLAYFLQKKYGSSLSIQLIEKSARPGGWVFTQKIGSHLFEMGPRTFKVTRARDLLDLVNDLGLMDTVVASDREALKRYLFYKGKLQLLPSNPFALLSSPLTRGLLPSLLKEYFIPPSSNEDESIYDFISRRFNAKTACTLFDPFTLGIYAGDIRKLSIKSCFPLLHEWEQKKGSLTKGIFSLVKEKMSSARKEPIIYSQLSHVGLFTLKDGIYRLIEALMQKLQMDTLFHAEVISLNPVGNKIEVATTHGSQICDHVFIATPVQETARLLSFIPDESLHFLQEIKTVTLAAVHLGFRQNLLQNKGFGYLIPSSEGEVVLGTVWDSVIFPHKNNQDSQTRLTVVMGGAHHPEVASFSNQKCLEIAKDAIRRHLGIVEEPDASAVTLAKHAVPQFEVGHSKKIAALEKSLAELCPQISLVGNYLDGVSVNACIERSKKIAEKFDKEFSPPKKNSNGPISLQPVAAR